jgi:hypothetical protein
MRENSYEKVNYLLRFKKQIERKIIIDTLRKLDVKINEYHYLGFGSIYFADFILFHKYLNINRMDSIDNKGEDKKRFEFNVPYGFIDFKICECHDFLELDLEWQDKLFIWLDYDTSLETNYLSDIDLATSKVKLDDIFLVTIEAEIPYDAADFKNNFEDYIPASIEEKNIKENYPGILNSIINTSIDNGLRKQIRTDITFLPIFNFTYKDTKKMYTLGGIFCDNSSYNKRKDMLGALDHTSRKGEIISIDCPFLTPKEKLHLDRLIQKGKVIDREKAQVEIGLEEEDIMQYFLYYKYYPQFFESIY